jgi:hypothetical protein
MVRASTTHHQEVMYMYVANGTSKMSQRADSHILYIPYLLMVQPPGTLRACPGL